MFYQCPAFKKPSFQSFIMFKLCLLKSNVIQPGHSCDTHHILLVLNSKIFTHMLTSSHVFAPCINLIGDFLIRLYRTSWKLMTETKTSFHRILVSTLISSPNHRGIVLLISYIPSFLTLITMSHDGPFARSIPFSRGETPQHGLHASNGLRGQPVTNVSPDRQTLFVRSW